jgi:hypothetical protein
MKQITKHLDVGLLEMLNNSVGAQWLRFGALDLLLDFDIAPESAFFETSLGCFELLVSDEVIDLFDEPESFAVLHLVQHSQLREGLGRANTSELWSGSTIVNIYLLISEIKEICDGRLVLDYATHDGLVFELSKGWIGLTKEGLFEIDVHVSAERTLGALDLYKPELDWISGDSYRYQVHSELISIADWLARFR